MSTLTITKKVQEHLEVTFPLYYQFGSKLVKIVSSDAFLSVQIDNNGNLKCATVEQRSGYDNSVNLYVTEGKQITKHDFENALDLALSSLVALPTLSNY